MSNAYYPPSKIVLTNEKIIQDKILKFGELIQSINKDKKYLINKDQVVLIEQDVMKVKTKIIKKKDPNLKKLWRWGIEPQRCCRTQI